MANIVHTASVGHTKGIPVIADGCAVVLIDSRIDRAVDARVTNGTAHAVSAVYGVAVDVFGYAVVVHARAWHAVVPIVVVDPVSVDCDGKAVGHVVMHVVLQACAHGAAHRWTHSHALVVITHVVDVGPEALF